MEGYFGDDSALLPEDDVAFLCKVLSNTRNRVLNRVLKPGTEPLTRNPKPKVRKPKRILDWKPENRKPKPETRIPEPWTFDLQSYIPHPRPSTLNPEYRTLNTGPRTPHPAPQSYSLTPNPARPSSQAVSFAGVFGCARIHSTVIPGRLDSAMIDSTVASALRFRCDTYISRSGISRSVVFGISRFNGNPIKLIYLAVGRG